MAKQLHVSAGPDEGRFFPVPAHGTLIIGSSHRHTDVCLHDNGISRVHCQVETEGEKAVVCEIEGDLFVNDKKITRHELHPGDVIRIGHTQLAFQDEGEFETVEDAADDIEVVEEEEVEVVAVADDEEVVEAVEVEGDEEAEVIQAVVLEEEAEPDVVAEPVQAKKPVTAKTKPPPDPTEGMKELIGRNYAHYAVGPVVAKGHAGLVFRARDHKVHRVVALKVLRPDFPKTSEEMQRFVQVVKATLPLRHPHLVTLFGAGRNELYCWLALEYIEGKSLAQLINWSGEAKMLDWRHALRVAVHIARALDYAHQHQQVHRNLTPPNILIRSSDKVALLNDLLLARALDESALKQVTLRTKLHADLNFLAPEQTYSAAGDARSDLHSLGAIAFTMVTGQAPFAGKTQAETVSKIRETKPAKLKAFQFSLPEAFEAAILRLLAKDPDDRFQSAAEVVKILEQVAKDHEVKV